MSGTDGDEALGRGAAASEAMTATAGPGSSSGPRDTVRHLVRNSATTYARLFATLMVGLILTPYLSDQSRMGIAGYGLYVMMFSAVGLVAIFQSTVRGSVVRELGEALHSGRVEEVPRRFLAACAACALCGVFVLAATGVTVPVITRLLRYPPEMEMQVVGTWLTFGVFTTIIVVSVPALTLLDVANRIPTKNLSAFCERASSLVAAVSVYATEWGRTYPLLAFVIAEAALVSAMRVGWSAYAMLTFPTSLRGPLRVDTSAMRRMLFVGKSMMQQEASISLYDRVNQLLINVFLGPVMNGIFGCTALLVGYTKQVAQGLSYGIEPLATQMSTEGETGAGRMRELIVAVTRVQAGVVLPVVAALGALGPMLIEAWLGDRWTLQWATANSDIATALAILLVGSPFFVVMQGTMRIMVGAGEVHRYAPTLLWSGIGQAALATVTLWLGPGLLEGQGLEGEEVTRVTLFAVVGGMSAVYLVTYGWYVPRVACRVFGLSARRMYVEAMGPGAAVGAVVLAGIAAVRWAVEVWSGWLLLGVVVGAEAVSAVLFWVVVLRKAERARLVGLVRGRGR